MLGYKISRILFLILLKTCHGFKVYGREHLPKKGPFICACNHLSYGDPACVGIACNTQPLHFMAKKELFKSKKWGWWFRLMGCIPISRDKKDYKATKEVAMLAKKSKCIAIFPEGRRSKNKMFQKAETGAGFLAIKLGIPVIPMRVFGTDQALTIENKYNIGKNIRLCIGAAIDFSETKSILDKKEKYIKASEKIMHEISRLNYENINS